MSFQKIKHRVRDFGLTIAPVKMTELLSWRSQKFIIRQERKSGRLRSSNEFVSKMGTAVLNGPFRGMIYPVWTAKQRDLISKLISSYEDELTPWIELLVTKNYPAILNVGSADGYYSVGFALRSSNSRIIAFDTDSWAREATRRLAEENLVNNVEVLSMCTSGWLAEKLEERSLLVVDCEGYESKLLDPSMAAPLLGCDILVELHEHVVPGLEQMIRNWYSASHVISEISSVAKRADDYQSFDCISRESLQASIDEGRRMTQKWLLLQRMATVSPA